MDINRRDEKRIPLYTFLTEYVQERPQRGMITNVSEHGLRVQRLLRPTHRSSRVVQLEFELPGTNEVIWAKGEACFDELELAPFGPTGAGPSTTIHSSGVRVVALANRHRRLMRDYVIERRREQLQEILARISHRRRH
jgi:hypothetical protein